MLNRSVRVVLMAVLVLSLGVPVLAQIKRPPRVLRPPIGAVAVKLATPTLSQVKGVQRLQLLGKNVVMQGYYYDGSVPMLIDEFQKTLCDMELPSDSYILLSARPSGVRSGDMIKIQGTLKQPSGNDPAWMQDQLIILEPSATARPTILKRATTLVRLRPLYKLKLEYIGPLLMVKKYAVLIVGGGSAASNHYRYWRDLKTMYNILLSHGYQAGNIYVIYASGTGRDADVPVNYSASKANIATVFNELAGKMTSLDTLYVMINDHGGGFLAQAIAGYGPGSYGGQIDTNGDEGAENISEAAYNRDFNGDGDRTDMLAFDETISLWGDRISDDEFAVEVNKITNYSKMIFQMKQCFGGGFVRDLLGTNRIVMASCSPVQASWADTINQHYGEFTYHYFAALTGQKPDGSGVVNADANGNGKVSMVEAYNYAQSHDGRPETPCYDDNGAMPIHSGNMPSGGDGPLGLATHL